jgi:hypothetical protein
VPRFVAQVLHTNFHLVNSCKKQWLLAERLLIDLMDLKI